MGFSDGNRRLLRYTLLSGGAYRKGKGEERSEIVHKRGDSIRLQTKNQSKKKSPVYTSLHVPRHRIALN